MSEQANEVVASEEDFDADLDSGFSDEVSDELTETPSEIETAVEDTEAEEVVPEQPKYAQITEDQFNELMSKASRVETLEAEYRRSVDQIFGKMGSMKQLLEQRQAETAAGETVEFTADDFAEIANDFPELAETLTKTLSQAAKKLRGTGSVSQAPIDLAPIKDELRVQLNEEMLEDEHEGWRDYVQTNDFKAWLGTKPQDFQQKLIGSTRFKLISKNLSECKGWAAERQEAARKTQEKEQKQSARFAAAVNPKSASSNAGSTSKSEDDLLDEGVN